MHYSSSSSPVPWYSIRSVPVHFIIFRSEHSILALALRLVSGNWCGRFLPSHPQFPASHPGLGCTSSSSSVPGIPSGPFQYTSSSSFRTLHPALALDWFPGTCGRFFYPVIPSFQSSHPGPDALAHHLPSLVFHPVRSSTLHHLPFRNTPSGPGLWDWFPGNCGCFLPSHPRFPASPIQADAPAHHLPFLVFHPACSSVTSSSPVPNTPSGPGLKFVSG